MRIESAETGMLAVDDLEGVEEVLERVEDDGITLEPFNLAKEREEGHFDEGGNYVENREEEDASAQDAWLTSDEGRIVPQNPQKPLCPNYPHRTSRHSDRFCSHKHKYIQSVISNFDSG